MLFLCSADVSLQRAHSHSSKSRDSASSMDTVKVRRYGFL